MALCVESRPLEIGNNSIYPVLVLSQADTCSTYYLVEAKDLEGQLTGSDVGLLFSACASLYALVFVFKLARRQFGF
ncbi:hypothetical protein [Shewanella glacialipiscicola]|uniref:hypothetical protein n=1 Tax=Shewanella glacialipiscicola TaxID=614069 RepID=UPI003D7A5590